MARVKKDPTHITQIEHDEASGAKRVRLVDTEIAMELDHTDGDSVTSHPAKLVISVTGLSAEDNGDEIVPAIDCSSIREIEVHIEGSGSVSVLVSPVDQGSYFIPHTGSGKVVARRIKIVSVDAVGSVHVVGRS